MGDRGPMDLRRLDAALAIVVVAGLALRLWGLGGQSLWYDEWLTAEAVSGSLPDLMRHVANREGIPPAYFVGVWSWVRLAGDGEVALRVVSAVCGAATIPVAYAIARELEQPRAVARVAALAVAVSPMLVWYSQEARPYALIALVGALSFLAFVRAWRCGRGRELAIWAAVAAATVAVHYVAAFLVAAEGLALLARRPQQWRAALLAAVPAAAVVGLLAPLAVQQHSHRGNRLWITRFPLGERLGEAGRSALVGPSPPDGRLWLALAVVVVVAGLVVAVGSATRARTAVALAGGVGGAGVALPVLLAATGIEDALVGRYLIASLVPLVVAVAVGLATAPRGITVPAVAAVVVVSLGVVVSVQRDPDLQKPDWEAVAAAVEATGGGDHALVVNVQGAIASPLLRYLDGSHPLEPGRTAQVTEIDVLHTQPVTRPCNFLVGRACGFLFLATAPAGRLAGELTAVGRIELDQFVIERFRPDRTPVTVSTADLVAPHEVAGALVLVADG